MSKTVSGPTEANIGNNNNFVTCFFVKQRVSGDIQGFAAHDKNITQDLASLGDTNGSIVYQAASSFIQTAISNTNTMAVDNLEVEGILDPLAFDQDDIDAGIYDRAEIKIFMVDWTDLTLDPIALRRGHIGTISTAEKSFIAELRGMLQRYTDEIVELYSPTCRVDLGSTRCGVRREPPLWTASTAYTVREVRDAATGSVVRPLAFNDRHFKCTVAGTSGGSEPTWNTTIGGTTVDGGVTWTTEQALTIEVTVDTVTNNGVFSVVYSGDAPDALLTGGLLTFIGGHNANVLPIEVKTWVLSTRTITLFLPAPFNVGGITDSFLGLEDGSGNLLLEGGDDLLLESGDVLKINAGCAKDRPACIGFDNIFNAQAEFVVPGTKVLFRTPNAQ
jgi:uncharacterized phage protein (TIGR02218 family)